MESAISVSQTLKLCIAHRLMNHNGKCRNLHGHNYKVTAHFSVNQFNTESGMVIDFGILKKVVLKRLDDQYDHTTFLHVNDPLVPILEQAGMTVVRTISHPTAENMCYFFVVQINNLLIQLYDGQVFCNAVSVEETDGCEAFVRVDAQGLIQEIKDTLTREAINEQPAATEEQPEASSEAVPESPEEASSDQN